MSFIPTPDEAFVIIQKYNQEPFHLEHAQTVSKVMGVFAEEYDPERVEFWKTVGMLHDIDFELYPEQHCVKAQEMLTEMDMDESVIHAVVSHGWGICSDVEPTAYMEKVLFAVDELTGLIGAAALMRPSKSTKDMELKSLKKKYKTQSFAAGCSREVIERGAAQLGWELDKLLTMTLQAMAACEDQIAAAVENE